MRKYESYKNSGISWIGDIPEHWDIRRNKNCLKEKKLEVGKSKDHVLLSLTKQGVIVRDTTTGKGKFPKDFESYKIVEKGNIIFCLFDVDETPRTVGLSSYQGMITGAYNVFEIFAINPQYLYFLYESIDDRKALRSLYTGLRKVIKIDKFLNAKLPIPSIKEQQYIVDFLNDKTAKIDAYIFEKEKELISLEELKQVEIATAVTRGVNPSVAMKDSGISWIDKIPEHWSIKRLALEYTENKTINKSLKYTNAYQFNYGTLIPKAREFTKEDTDTYSKYTIVHPNDILINGLNLNFDFVSRRVAMAVEKGIITSAYLCLRPREDTYSPFFCYLFKAMDSMKLFHGMGTGVRLTLSFSELKKYQIPVPPLPEQKEIACHVKCKLGQIDTYKANIEQQIVRLKEYRQTLISDAVTGKINVQPK